MIITIIIVRKKRYTCAVAILRSPASAVDRGIIRLLILFNYHFVLMSVTADQIVNIVMITGLMVMIVHSSSHI